MHLGSLGTHDVGGIKEDFGDIDRSDRPYQLWERRVHAAYSVLASKQLVTVDELRRAIEALPESTQKTWP